MISLTINALKSFIGSKNVSIDISGVIDELETLVSTGDDWVKAVGAKMDTLEEIKDGISSSVDDIRDALSSLENLAETKEQLDSQINEAEQEDIYI